MSDTPDQLALVPADNTAEALLVWALKAQGYDGLYELVPANPRLDREEDIECGCFLDDLAPCGNSWDAIARTCRGGYRIQIGDDEGIAPVKPVTLAQLEALGQATLFGPEDPTETP